MHTLDSCSPCHIHCVYFASHSAQIFGVGWTDKQNEKNSVVCDGNDAILFEIITMLTQLCKLNMASIFITFNYLYSKRAQPISEANPTGKLQ